MDGHQHEKMDMAPGPMKMPMKDNHTGMDHLMNMYFTTNYENLYVLFSCWKLHTVWELVGSAVGIFLLAVIYEGLKSFREYLGNVSKSCCCTGPSNELHLQKVNGAPTDSAPHHCLPNENTPLVCKCRHGECLRRRPSPFRVDHFVQTLLHMVQVVISYFLMLIFMTYNVYLCLAVVLGAGLGYFLFAWRHPVSSTQSDHCN